MLLSLTDEDWHQCETGDKLETCIEAMESNRKKVHDVDNEAPIKTICGEVVVAQSAPTTWSYRGLTPYSHRPLRIVKLSVKC